MTTLEKYIWVVNALYRAGSLGLSLKELLTSGIMRPHYFLPANGI